MKLTFTPPTDAAHGYCLRCLRETLRCSRQDGRLNYVCGSCGCSGARALIIDPQVKWWVGADREYWHESAGIFLADDHGRFLFFERMQHPFGLAVPAGHVDAHELPIRSAQRELDEETGVVLGLDEFRFVATDDIYGDECRRGADAHRWTSYAARVPSASSVAVDQREGAHPVWLSLRQVLRRNLTLATRYVIVRHGHSIIQAAK